MSFTVGVRWRQRALTCQEDEMDIHALFSLKGKTAVVTGASGALGGAAVRAMAPVAGMPPNSAEVMFPAPCAISSILER